MIDGLAQALHSSDPDKRRKHLPDRTLELHLLDLDTTFRGDLIEGNLVNIQEDFEGPKANIRISMNSDDLVELTDGRLKFATAWATGRIHLDASIRDLLRLRSLL